jgi:hypothetical protein
MAGVSKRPEDFVKYLTNPGLATDVGSIPLKQYMCANVDFGGNENAKAVLGAARWMNDVAGEKKTLNAIIGGHRFDVLLKGQGHPDDVVTAMNFLVRNKEQLKTKKLEGKGTIFDVYFKGTSDSGALNKMVDDKVFGLDCIGFVSNYLIWVKEFTEYPSYTIEMWAQRYFTNAVTDGDEASSLCAVIWPNYHIAMVDRVRSWDGRIINCDVSQSSTGGPIAYNNVSLEATKGGFTITGGNSVRTPPTVPVGGTVQLRYNPDLVLRFPTSPSQYPAASISPP